jgi:hypothetical protein
VNQFTLDFFLDYEQLLDTINESHHVHTVLADWLFHMCHAQVEGLNNLPHNVHYTVAQNNSRVGAVASDLNVSLDLTANKRFHPHIPTAAIGNMSGIVYVSANPLVGTLPNLQENNFRNADIANNRDFCACLATFNEKADGHGGNWWSHAIKLTHLVYTGSPDLLPAHHRWNWLLNTAAPVCNVDLLPFHSSADGFGMLQRNHPTAQLLRSLALSTLRMILRIAPVPRLIFVGSPLGAALLAEYHLALGLNPVANPANEPAPFDQIQRYLQPNTGAQVMTFPRQIFTGFFNSNPPAGFHWLGLAERMRVFCNPPFHVRA